MEIDDNAADLLERAYARHEARKRAARALMLPEQQIKPVLTEDQLDKLKPPFCIKSCFLTPDAGPKEIEPNVVYKDGKELKFLLLPKGISHAAWLEAHVAAMASKPQKGSRRAANAQVHGRKLTIGWIKNVDPRYPNMRTAPTLEHPELVAALLPMLHDMDVLIDQNVPLYHDYAWRCAMQAIRPAGERDDLSRVKKTKEYKEYLRVKATEKPWPPIESLSDDEINKETAGCAQDPYAIVEHLDAWDWTYTLRGTPFSTIEFNHNIVFKSHEDGNNVEGTCVCIATLGSFAGGRLIFPRYGYSASLENRDLLICDNNLEQHGNLGPIVGDRFTVVAFLHNSVIGRVPVAD